MIYHSDGRLLDIHRLESDSATYRPYSFWFLKPQVYLSDVVSFATSYNTTASYPRAVLLKEEDNLLTISKEYPYESYKKEISGFSSYETSTMYRFNDQIRTYKAINDTMFTVGLDMEMGKAFVFDLGKYRASTDWMFEMNPPKNLIYIWPLNIMESSDYLFIEFFFGNHAPERFEYLTFRNLIYTNYTVCGVFDKRTGKLKLMNQPIERKLGFKNDIDNGPVIWPHYISSNNELVSYIQPEEFMDIMKKSKILLMH